MSLDGLSYKQRLFVEAYLGPSNGNATDAARRAGYRWPDKVAERLVGKSGIRAAIAARLTAAAIPANHVLAIISDHATASPEDFGDVDENGFRLRLDKAKRRKKLHCIKKLKPVRIRLDDDNADPDSPPQFRTDYEIEFYDAQSALDKIGKFYGLWKDKIEQTVELTPMAQAASDIQAAFARVCSTPNSATNTPGWPSGPAAPPTPSSDSPSPGSSPRTGNS